MRKKEIQDAVKEKLEDKGQTVEKLSLDKLKTYTDRIEQESEWRINQVEEKEQLARENQEKFKSLKKKTYMEKEYNKARRKIIKEQRESDQDKELMDKINDKPFKKE